MESPVCFCTRTSSLKLMCQEGGFYLIDGLYLSFTSLISYQMFYNAFSVVNLLYFNNEVIYFIIAFMHLCIMFISIFAFHIPHGIILHIIDVCTGNSGLDNN